MKQIVICCNDYPEEVLVIGSTHEQAATRCHDLDKNSQDSLVLGYIKFYYRWHEVEVFNPNA